MARLWAFVGSMVFIVGCSGDQGPQGEAGPQGDPGPQGEQGPQGDPGEDGQSVALGYAGSSTCGGCHARQYASWENSGHPYKIVPKQEILDGTGYPPWIQSDVHGDEFAVDADFFDAGQGGDQVLTINADTFPNGWDDITYVIGGYGWKARFINNEGYIITGLERGDPGDTGDDDKTQYNFPLEVDAFGPAAYPDVPVSSSRYHPEDANMKPYNCGSCHTTGWVPDTDADTDGDLSDNQDGLPGIHGTWVEPGIGCEGCHGPGAGHADNPYEVATQWDASASCSSCHIRSDIYEVDTSGGFIRHHEQFEELIQGKHSALLCEGCHDSHEPVRFSDTYIALDDTPDDPNPDFPNFGGVRIECTSCHFSQAESYDVWAANVLGMAGVTCEQCHMPHATKSAVRAGTFYGDTMTHLFGINTWVDPINPDSSLSTTGAKPANPYISLDWACGSCHSDEAEADPNNLYNWALGALNSFGGVHGNTPVLPLP